MKPVSMTTVEWDLIKSKLDDLAEGQKQVNNSLKVLHECVDDSKDQIKDLKDSVDDMQQMILNMVPNGDIFQHRFDHVEIADTRGLKRVGRIKAVEVAVAGGLALLAAAFIFYLKFGAKQLDTGFLKSLGSNEVAIIAARPEVKNKETVVE